MKKKKTLSAVTVELGFNFPTGKPEILCVFNEQVNEKSKLVTGREASDGNKSHFMLFLLPFLLFTHCLVFFVVSRSYEPAAKERQVVTAAELCRKLIPFFIFCFSFHPLSLSRPCLAVSLPLPSPAIPERRITRRHEDDRP